LMGGRMGVGSWVGGGGGWVVQQGRRTRTSGDGFAWEAAGDRGTGGAVLERPAGGCGRRSRAVPRGIEKGREGGRSMS